MAELTFECQVCRTALSADESQVGALVRCPLCKATLRVPRLDSPRERVPAGSVAIADEFSAVYPAATPGGWRLLGRCDQILFDVDRDPPALLQPGTRKGFGRLIARIEELRPATVLVGLPLSLSGGDTDQTRETRAFVQRLSDRLNVPIEVYDERFTTKLARRTGGVMAEDSRAAAVLLEEWLTRLPAHEPHPADTAEGP